MELVLEIACNVADTLEQAVGLGEEDLLRVALLTLERVQVGESVEVSLLVTDDEGLRELNRDFRGRDETTDVLSFPLLDTPLVDAPDDELWQPGEQGAAGAMDETSGQGAWPGGDDLGAAGLTASADENVGGEDDEEEAEDDDAEDAPLHLGDIAISRDAVVRQAAAAGHSAARECAYLFAHGLLHLVGYDDATDAGYRAMVAHQEAALAEAHIAR
jgi:probable rRNA maturation factor